MNRPIKPLKSSGVSQNINYYGEPLAQEERIWVSVLCSTIAKDPETSKFKLVKPTYYGTIYQHNHGEIGRFKYEPRRTPNPIALSDRTVTRLVREALLV